MRTIFFVAFTAGTLLLSGCSSDTTNASTAETKTASKKQEPALTQADLDKVVSKPNDFKGREVDFYAKVFVRPEKDKEATYLQTHYKVSGDSGNIIVGIKDPNLDVKEEDIIHVHGVIKGEFEGENALGGKVTAATVTADKVEKSDYATAFAPAKKTVEVNQQKDQHGVVLKVNKIELAEQETRVYLDVINNSGKKSMLFQHEVKLVQNGQQFEAEDAYEQNYPKLQSELLNGVTSTGVIVFKALPQTGALELHMEAHNENYSLDFQPYVFQVNY